MLGRLYLDWWDKGLRPRRIPWLRLAAARLIPDAGKYFSAAAGPTWAPYSKLPRGVSFPSPVVSNTHRPIWDYTFLCPPIRWMLSAIRHDPDHRL